MYINCPHGIVPIALLLTYLLSALLSEIQTSANFMHPPVPSRSVTLIQLLYRLLWCTEHSYCIATHKCSSAIHQTFSCELNKLVFYQFMKWTIIELFYREGYLGLPTTVLGRPQTPIPNPIPNPTPIPIPNTNPGTSQDT